MPGHLCFKIQARDIFDNLIRDLVHSACVAHKTGAGKVFPYLFDTRERRIIPAALSPSIRLLETTQTGRAETRSYFGVLFVSVVVESVHAESDVGRRLVESLRQGDHVALVITGDRVGGLDLGGV